MGIVLASTSPYRNQLLQRLGFPFEQRSPLCDESCLKRGPYPGAAGLARMLATAKIESLVATHPNDTLIGGDQVVDDPSHLFSFGRADGVALTLTP